MGSAFYVELEKEIEGLDPAIDGKMLARAEGHLSAMAEDLEVEPPIKFVVIPAERLEEFLLEIELEELIEDAAKVEEVWFDAAPGLASLKALASALEAEPEDFGAFSGLDAGAVLAELREVEAILERAAAEGVRWRFGVDY